MMRPWMDWAVKRGGQDLKTLFCVPSSTYVFPSSSSSSRVFFFRVFPACAKKHKNTTQHHISTVFTHSISSPRTASENKQPTEVAAPPASQRISNIPLGHKTNKELLLLSCAACGRWCHMHALFYVRQQSGGVVICDLLLLLSPASKQTRRPIKSVLSEAGRQTGKQARGQKKGVSTLVGRANNLSHPEHNRTEQNTSPGIQSTRSTPLTTQV